MSTDSNATLDNSLTYETHACNIDIARRYGYNVAHFLHDLKFWIVTNIRDRRNLRDGLTWSYKTLRALSLHLALSVKELKTVIKVCDRENLIFRSSKYNKKPGDRTNWYSFTEKGAAFYPEINAATLQSYPQAANPRQCSKAKTDHPANPRQEPMIPLGPTWIPLGPALPDTKQQILQKEKIKDLLPSRKKRAKKTYDCPYFNEFYNFYPRKGDKDEASKEFHELTKTMNNQEKREFVDGLMKDIIERLSTNWADGKEFIPYAKKYLGKRKFEEDIIPRRLQRDRQKFQADLSTRTVVSHINGRVHLSTDKDVAL